MTVPCCHAPYVIARHGSEAFRDELPDQRIAAINATIREIAASEDLPLIDVNHIIHAIGGPGEGAGSLLRNEVNSNVTDGVRPTRDGYRVIATAIFQAIESTSEIPVRILCLVDSITFEAGMIGAGTASDDTYRAMLARLLNSSR